mmetsp:Transcript_90006/g.263100  ORF Transcript_90006/g.263100 Transcript_90006/m.263100 type:complete len:455 (-) Transcript_90006:3-1367(-)
MPSCCAAARGGPGARRTPPLLLLGAASLCARPAGALFQVADAPVPGRGIALAGEAVLGNGDDLPGFGAFRAGSRHISLARESTQPAEHAQERTKHGYAWSYGQPPTPRPRSVPPALKRFLFFLSIVIAFCGSTLTVMGMVLQKHAHQKCLEEADAEVKDENDPTRCMTDRSCYLFHWRWILGLAIFAAGNAVTWVALGMGPNSVLACFNSWNIIFSMVVAPMFFGERVPREAKLSAVLLIGGCIWVTIAGPRSYRLHTVDSINMLFARFPFTLCCVACFTILVAAKIKHWFWQGTRVWSAATSVQITSMASIFACYAVLFSKCTSMLVQSSVATNVSQVGYWQFYLWAGATVVCGICQVYFLNESLRHGFASFVIPAYESMGMALQIVVGGIFFREYRNYTLKMHLTFWPGVALVLSGLVFLTRSVAHDQLDAEAEGGAAGAPPREACRARAAA